MRDNKEIDGWMAVSSKEGVNVNEVFIRIYSFLI